MTNILCPQCGFENTDPEGVRSASGFCQSCDYPLFFARGVVNRVEDDSDMARTRLPGVAGMSRRAWLPCPDCGELNPREGTNCLRCGAILAQPEAEPEPEPEANVVIREVLIPAPDEPRWPLFLLGMLVGILTSAVSVFLYVWLT